eukprot:791286-Prorocentrum_minimum.AAC.1
MGRRCTRRQRSKKHWEQELRLMCIGGMWTGRGVGRYAACLQGAGGESHNNALPLTRALSQPLIMGGP